MPASGGGGGSLGTIRGSIKIDYDGAGVARATNDVDKLKNKAGSTEAAWNKVAVTSAVAGAGIAAGFALAVRAAAGFEKGLSNIQAVSGATRDQMEQVRAKALQLGKDTKFSASEAAQAMEELAKAGLSIPDIMNGAADATVALAAAGEVSLPEAATIASNAMNQFNLSAKDMPRIADLIAGAANASAIDVHDLGMSIAQAGAVSHLAGLSFSDTATAIALMGNAGIKGSDAGTSLKTFLQNLIPQTKQQIQMMKDLGIVTANGGNQFFTASGKVKSLADISQTLQNAMKGMSKEQQLATLQTLFGSDAIRAAAILANNGASGFNNMAASMAKVKAADVAKTKMNNLAGSMEQLKGSLETGAIAVGSILLPQLKKLVDFLTGLANSFASLSPGTQTFILQTAGVVAAILLLLGAFIKIMQFMKALKVAWTALNATFITSPIGLIIIAIIALVAIFVILWNKSAAFRNFWIGLWNGIWGVLKAIGAWFAGPFAGFFVRTWNAIWGFFKSVGAWFAGPFANFFVSAWNAIVTAFRWVAGVIGVVINAVVAYFRFWWAIASAVIGFFAPAIRAAFNLVVAIIRTVMTIISAIFQVGWTIISAIVRAVIGFIIGFITTQFNILKAIFMAVFNFLAPIVMGAFNAIRNAIVAVISFLTPYIVGAWNWIRNAITLVMTTIWNVIMTVWNFIKGIIVGAVNAITGYYTAAISFWGSVFSTGFNIIRSIVSNVINAVVGFVRSGVNGIAAVFNGIRAIVNRVGAFFGELKNAASGGVGSLLSFVSGIPGRILSALGNLGGLLFNVGRDIINGLVNGIKGLAGRVMDAVQSIINSIPSAVRKLLGIGSPSRVMMELGQYTVEGYVKGLGNRAALSRQAIASTIATPAVSSVTHSIDVGGVTMQVPSPVIDPSAQAMYFARKLNAALAVRG